MYDFRAGVLLKDMKVIIAEGADNEWVSIVKEAGYEFDKEAMATDYVLVKLTYTSGQFWTPVDDWEYSVCQEEVPVWYEESKEAYEKEFRAMVTEWAKDHVIHDAVLDEIGKGYFMLSKCTINSVRGDAKVECVDCTINEVDENAVVVTAERTKIREMMDHGCVRLLTESSTIGTMHDDTTVHHMYNDTKIFTMSGCSMVNQMFLDASIEKMESSSSVSTMSECSVVEEMYDKATITLMEGDSTIWDMFGNSCVEAMDNCAHIETLCDESHVDKMYGKSWVGTLGDNTYVGQIYDEAYVEITETNGRINEDLRHNNY